jgi:hypothetical protein
MAKELTEIADVVENIKEASLAGARRRPGVQTRRHSQWSHCDADALLVHGPERVAGYELVGELIRRYTGPWGRRIRLSIQVHRVVNAGADVCGEWCFKGAWWETGGGR